MEPQKYKFELGQTVICNGRNYIVIDRDFSDYSTPTYYLENWGWVKEQYLKDSGPEVIKVTTADLDKAVKIAVTRKIELVRSSISEVQTEINRLKDELKKREVELAQLHCNRGALIQVEKLL